MASVPRSLRDLLHFSGPRPLHLLEGEGSAGQNPRVADGATGPHAPVLNCT